MSITKVKQIILTLVISTINFMSVYKLMGTTPGILSFIVILVFFALLNIKKSPTKIKMSVLGQCSVICGFIFLFVHSAILSSISNITHTLRGVCLSTLIAIALLYLLHEYITKSAEKSSRQIKEKILCNKWLMVVLLLAILLRVVQFKSIPIWDSELYYLTIAHGCQTFDFSVTGFLNNFMLLNHPSFGYASILGIGEFILPGYFYGIHMVNLVLSIFAIIFIYEILQCCLSKTSKCHIALGTLLITSSPLFLGTFSYIHMDYGIAIFFIYVVYMHIKKRYILCSFFALILLTTKEVGIVVYAGYLCGIVLFKLLKQTGNIFARMFKVLKQKEIWFLAIPILAACVWIILILNGIISFWNPIDHNSTSSSIAIMSDVGKDAINVIGINNEYISYRLKQIFAFDGHWVITIVNFFCVVVIVCKKIRNKSNGETQNKNKYLSGIAMSGVFMTLFSIFYITYSLMRYNIVLEIMWAIITVYLFLYVIQKTLLPTIILLIVALFNCCQSFVSIDPITNMLTKQVDTGCTPMNFLTNNTTWPGDPFVYNYHYNYLNKIIDNILKEIDYKGQTIIILGEQPTLWPAGQFDTFVWDTDRMKRTYFDYNNKDTIGFKTLYIENTNNVKKQDLPEEAIAIFLSQYEVDMKVQIKKMREYYNVSQEHTLTIPIMGNSTYYILNKKETV